MRCTTSWTILARPGTSPRSRARLADGLEGDLGQFLRRSASAAGPAAVVDPAVAERLSALGYVSGSAGAPKASGVDPKDRIAIANTLHDAILAVEDGAFARAIPLLEKVVVGEPEIPIAQLNLGVAYARQHQYARAIPPLRRAASLQPDNMRGHYELGLALYSNGDQKGAAAELGVVATALPQWADARYSLGSVYARIDRVPDAMTELRAALALEPRHFRANLLLGRLLTLTGKAAEAASLSAGGRGHRSDVRRSPPVPGRRAQTAVGRRRSAVETTIAPARPWYRARSWILTASLSAFVSSPRHGV